MSFSTADYIAMKARLERTAERTGASFTTAIKEVGKGGIQDQIQEHMKSLIPNIWYDVKRADMKTTSRVGVPDFVGCYHGVCFAIECKTKTGKATSQQLGELKWLELAGAKTCIAHSLAEAVEFLQSL